MAAEAAAVRPDEAEEAAPPPPSRPAGRRKMILVAAPLLLGVVGAGLWFSGILPHLFGARGRPAAADAADPVTFPMPEMVANLAGANGVERFVKVDIRLVVANPAALAKVRKNVPQLQDLFLTYLRDMHPSELQSSTGTWRLREELLTRAAIAVGPGLVTDVLFTNLLIQ
jgi:flagellar protein FliL